MRLDVLSVSAVWNHHLSGEASTVLPLHRGCLSKHQQIVHKCITTLNHPLRWFSVCNDIFKVPWPNKKLLVSTNTILASPLGWTLTGSPLEITSVFAHSFLLRPCAQSLLAIELWWAWHIWKFNLFLLSFQPNCSLHDFINSISFLSVTDYTVLNSL